MSESTTEKNSVLIDAVKSIAFPLISIIVAILVSGFFVLWAKGYPLYQYFSALGELFRTIVSGAFGNQRKSLETLVYVTPLLFTGVANAVAFRCGLFNIGVEGQFIVGMLAASIVGLIPGLSIWVHIPLLVIAGTLAGMLWGAIPGYLKAKVGINEVVNTIMMNYIAMYFSNWVTERTIFTVPNQANTPVIQPSAQLPRFIPLSQANISIFVAIICAILIYWLFWKTTIGYEIRAVGINPYAGEYGGINIKKNIILAMAISGALAGMGGALHMSGVKLQSQDLMAFTGFGTDGIAVALLAKSNPIGCIISAVLFGALSSSSKTLQLNGIPKEIVYLIQAIIIIFVSSDYIIKYLSARRKKKGVIING